jgi:antitoxin (DNA-binding transcriptional repressor) of toxin-antitoxin stability system
METYRARTVSIDNAASRLDELADRAGAGAPVHLKRGRKVVAVLVSPEDAETVARERREMAADVRAAEKALREIERDGGEWIPWERVKRELTADRRKRKR